VQPVAALESFLQVSLAYPCAGFGVMVPGNGDDVVPAAGSFRLGDLQEGCLLRCDAEYDMTGLDHLILLHWDSMYCLMTSADTVPVVAQKYDRDQMCPFFFSSGNLAARVEPEPSLIFPVRSACEYRGGADKERWM